MLKIIPAKTILTCATAIFATTLAVTGPASANMWFYMMMQNQKRGEEAEKQWKNEPLPFELSKGLHRYQVLVSVLEAREQVCSLDDAQKAISDKGADRCLPYGKYVVYGEKDGVSRQIVLGEIVSSDIHPLIKVSSVPGRDGHHAVTELAPVDWFDALVVIKSREPGQAQ